MVAMKNARVIALLTAAVVVSAAASFSVEQARRGGISKTIVPGQRDASSTFRGAIHKKEHALFSAASGSAAEGGVGDDSRVRGGGAEGSSTSVGTASIPNEVFNLIKSIVGSGVFSLPYGVAAFGNKPSALLPATALIAIMGGLSGYTFGLIGRICQRTNTQSYADAWDVAVGKKWSPLIAFSCFFDCTAGNLSYSMILADTIKNLLASAGVAVTRTQSLLGVTALVLAPLCFLKNLSSLAPFSLVGIFGMLYTTVAMGLRWLGRTYQPGGRFFESQLAAPVFGSAGASAALSPKTFILTAMLSNAFIAHFNAPKFLTELKNPTMGRFHQVIAWSFGASVALSAIVTGAGFLTFGAASDGLILNNYSVNDVLMSFSRIAVAVSITCSYPLIFHGSRDGLLDLFKVKQEERTPGLLNKVTFAALIGITLLASQLTDLGLVAAVGGATFGTALTFIYPAVMFLKSQNKRSTESWYVGGVGVMGVAMAILGTVLSLKG